mmetsp:Transcript_26028/g.68341  ORF Transcript_26028/g.68341 Transcript_26028/m.68341 type:complete len:327 (+) Transcript_26028:4016-4996(+)
MDIYKRGQQHEQVYGVESQNTCATLRGHDVDRRKTQVHVPRVQPRSAGLSTVIAERKSCGHGNHEVRFEQEAKDENGKPRQARRGVTAEVEHPGRHSWRAIIHHVQEAAVTQVFHGRRTSRQNGHLPPHGLLRVGRRFLRIFCFNINFSPGRPGTHVGYRAPARDDNENDQTAEEVREADDNGFRVVTESGRVFAVEFAGLGAHKKKQRREPHQSVREGQRAPQHPLALPAIQHRPSFGRLRTDSTLPHAMNDKHQLHHDQHKCVQESEDTDGIHTGSSGIEDAAVPRLCALCLRSDVEVPREIEHPRLDCEHRGKVGQKVEHNNP